MSGNTGVLEAKTLRMDTPAVPRGRTQAAPMPKAKESLGARQRLKTVENKAFRDAKSMPGVSIFAIVGTAVIFVLMVFVLLAQINYNETAIESVRISKQLRELTEQQRTLEMAFHASFDIREVERIATNELGMSRPSAEQIITITTIPRDTAYVVVGDDDDGAQGFAEFIKSLFGYFQ